MHKTNITSLLTIWNIKHDDWHNKIIEIGDQTAIRIKNGIKYRRNYERGLLLFSLVNHFKVRKFLEFGTGRGFSTACALLADPSIEMFTIDSVSSSAAKNLLLELKFELKNVHFIESDSTKLGYKLPNDFDLVFIDGGHDYDTVKNDYQIALAHCSRGIILFDDYRNKHKGVKKVIKKIKKEKILVNSDGWIFENKLIHEVGDADNILDGKETASGQVIVPIGLSIEEIVSPKLSNGHFA
jgi:predicted O-methyltransferase YrrM